MVVVAVLMVGNCLPPVGRWCSGLFRVVGCSCDGGISGKSGCLHDGGGGLFRVVGCLHDGGSGLFCMMVAVGCLHDGGGGLFCMMMAVGCLHDGGGAVVGCLHDGDGELSPP
ncbi:hypothetical protein Tco_0821022 [Tanacetum coccineum]|uniref:Uncharacterized protein n=1 Tax=Tanacetum coccineum TaxID=301880 RepID=A0ABQ5AFA8_9ASTR